MKLKPISEQVVVLLGAASGIGRETALRFAERGAKVIVAARSEPGLASLVTEITTQGGEAAYAVCDVADYAQVEAVADLAVRRFGRIDTWVNVAAVSVYATFEDTTLDEVRRIMDVNFMGHVHGAKAALPHLRREGRGALIAISSVEGITSLPLHSIYAASKHAIEGWIDALRRELIADGVPISVTSIKPASINTPFFNNARSKMDVKPKGPPPIYAPSVVAECVLYAAEHPVRDLYAGGAGKMLATTQMLSPGLLDNVLARVGIPLQKTSDPDDGEDALYAPRVQDDRIEGDFTTMEQHFSPYTWMETHPGTATMLAGGLLFGVGRLLAQRVGQTDGLDRGEDTRMR
jgi:NAD(P)-dependent dehydrogenase (short-subunit alcohol dehydrogenase family)